MIRVRFPTGVPGLRGWTFYHVSVHSLVEGVLGWLYHPFLSIFAILLAITRFDSLRRHRDLYGQMVEATGSVPGDTGSNPVIGPIAMN